jgi:hypothetical protein
MRFFHIPVSKFCFLLQTGVGLNDAAQVIIAIVPLVSVIVLGILSFFFILWDQKNRSLIIQKGGTPPSHKLDEKILLLGIVSFVIGIGLLIFFIIFNGLSPSLLGGIIPTSAGLGIIIGYAIIYRKRV